MKTKFNVSPLKAVIGLVVLMAVSVFVQYKFFMPKVRTDWNREVNHQRDSIIRELKKEGIFFKTED